jgi:hypothetical protein
MIDVIVYDIEIRKCIPDKGKPLDPDLKYCGGWNDYDGMGIAVVCAIDTRDKVPRVFLRDNLPSFFELIKDRCVAGFNNHGFDDPLIRANGGIIDRSYDLLAALRVAAGEPPEYTYGVTKRGRSCDAVAKANNVLRKSDDGANAPIMWQQGRYGAVIDYCLRDVVIEYTLITSLPRLIDPVTGTTLELEMPV